MPWVRLDDSFADHPKTARVGSPCPGCGVAVVQDLGTLNAEAYTNGVVERHRCVFRATPVYITDRTWPAFKAPGPLFAHDPPKKPTPPHTTPREARPEPPDWEGLRRRGSK